MTRASIGDGRTKRARARRESRRQDILEAALRSFADKGYHGTHVSDIISAAGIARGTFYLYFEGKSAIFLELLDQLLVELRGSVVGVDVTPESPPIEVQLVATLRHILRTVVDNRLLTTIIIREAVGVDDEVDARLHAFYRKLRAYIRESLEEGQALGVVRSLDLDMAATCILGSIKQFMEQCVMGGDDDVDVDRIAVALLDFNLRGVLATKGVERTTEHIA